MINWKRSPKSSVSIPPTNPDDQKNKKKFLKPINKKKTVRFDNEAAIKNFSKLDQAGLLKEMNLTSFGLENDDYEKRLEQQGPNQLKKQGFSWIKEFLKNYFSPFNIILLIISVYNFVNWGTNNFTGNGIGDGSDLAGAVVVLAMVLISGTVSYFQTIRAYFSTKKISKLVESTVNVVRHKNGDEVQRYTEITKDNQVGLMKLGEELSVKDLVVGDLIYLSSGDRIPADVRIVYSNDLFVNQSSLTGESVPVEKHAVDGSGSNNILDLQNICYTGTSVISGSALAIVIGTGNSTYFAAINKAVAEKRPEGSFTKGIKNVTKVLVVFMLIMVPIVYLIYGGIHDAWLSAVFYAVAVAVGLTPEMLPLIVTTNLANGASKMAKQKVVVKQLDAIQALGAIDVLTTDKTGTLTNDKINLIDFLTVDKKPDPKLIRDLYINSYFQTGLKNPMDVAVIDYVNQHNLNFNTHDEIKKIDEIPFDFNRRRLTIVADIKDEGRTLITKGSMEEVLSCCSQVYYQGKVVKLTDDIKDQIQSYFEQVNSEGKRILGIAFKKITNNQSVFKVEDEKDLTFMGFATFLDTPKPSTKKMITLLKKYGVDLKILTGDNEPVTRAVCKMVGLKIKGLVTGDIIESASEYELKKIVEKNNIFVKLNPLQKVKIVQILKENNHTVGYMGDGINDAPVLRQADVAISVNNATDIAKDASDIILLEKSLLVLEKGIIQGRTIFGNILKYIKITTASNFGNTLSMIVASAWLPFLAMAPVQILFQNLIYDLSNLPIAFDHVDEKFISEPQRWRAKELIPFALINGPISSIFDIVTFAIMGYGFSYVHDFNHAQDMMNILTKGTGEYSHWQDVANNAVAHFNGGWFMEGLMTQSIVVQILRTEKVPFIQSRAAWQMNVSTVTVIGLGFIIGYVGPIAHLLSMDPPVAYYVAILFGILVCYSLLAQLTKIIYKKIFHTWL